MPQRFLSPQRSRVALPHHVAFLADVVAIRNTGEVIDVFVNHQDRLPRLLQLF